MKLIIFVIIAVIMMATPALCDVEYEIVDTKDVSMKALTKSLSNFNIREISQLPDVIRIKYKIIVPSNLSKKEYEQLFNEILDDIRAKNNDIDVIVASACDKENFGIANFSWYPAGGWAFVDSHIASSNNRKDYEFHINWSNNYLTKHDGLLKTIHKTKDSYVQTEHLDQNVPLITFDVDTGALEIISYIGTDLYLTLSEYDVLYEANEWLQKFPLQFKEVKRYKYSLFWKGTVVFELNTSRKEMNKLPLKKIKNEFNRAFERQQKKFDKAFMKQCEELDYKKSKEDYLQKAEEDYLREKEQEDKLELNMYFRKIFKYFKDKRINM